MNKQDILNSFEAFAEEYIDNQNSPSKTLTDAVRYSLLGGGKRIRALFVYTLGEMLNIDIQDCHKIAFAIECIHAYSLIHDDLPAMDNDSLRRGKPTSHIVYGEATAILAGDALQPLAFEAIQDVNISDISKLKKAIKTLSQSAGITGMVAGQQLDIEGEKKQLSLNELETVHINKTAKMFYASLLIPYIISKFTDDEVENTLTKIAFDIGLCFQIKDDILDITETSDTLGKTAQKDISMQKSTYVSLLGLDKAKTALQDKIDELKDLINILKSKKFETTQLEKLINLVVNRKH